MTDDLDLLRALRADLPPASAAARAAARARVAGAGPRRRRPGRRGTAAIAAAGAMAAAAVAIVSGVDDGRVGPASASARPVLARVAAVAARREGPGVPRDDQFFYIASEGTELVVTAIHGTSYSYFVVNRRESWLSVARRGRLSVREPGRPRFVTPTDRRRWIAAGRPPLEPALPPTQPMSPVRHYEIGSDRFSTAALRAYDPTPRQLFDRLRARVGNAGQTPDGEVFVLIADALRDGPQPPRLRATLYRALALVPGVELVGPTRDRLGRDAVGVAYTERTGLRHELLFDPRTSEVLAERQVVVRPVGDLTAPVGTAIEDVVYTRRAVTDAIARPRP
ncbi:MAG: hypothetical protein QOG70_1240 [Solirubrobacteraceae bacterium]|jgi:hypothetical protein|nr:hypothetical protein [Solirubrobacteraceae bacterium]